MLKWCMPVCKATTAKSDMTLLHADASVQEAIGGLAAKPTAASPNCIPSISSSPK
jgi:hypothetical protein